MVGAGPFWLGTSSHGSGGGRRRRASTTSASGPSIFGASRVRPNLAADYAAYREGLESAGVKRRNQLEIDAAWFHTKILDWAPRIALLQPHLPLGKPEVPAVPGLRDRGVRVIADLKANGEYRWWRKADRRRKDELAQSLGEDIERARAELTAAVAEAHRRYLALDPAMNLLVLQAAFADNGGTAAPVDLDGDQLLVFMSFPPAREVVWPETTTQTRAGKDSVRKRNSAEINLEYRRQLACHVLASAREAFLLQPALRSCRILVLLEEPGKPLPDTRVLLDGQFDRQPLLASSQTATGWEEDWDRVIALWTANSDSAVVTAAWNRFARHARTLADAQNGAFRQCLATADQKVGANERALAIGSLSSRFPGIDLSEFEVDQQHDHISYKAVIGPLDQDPLALGSCKFWAEALEQAQTWTEVSGATAG